MHKIVVVEDEEDILDLIQFTLSDYKVFTFTSTNGVKSLLDKEEIDLIIMDRNLPGTEGSIFIQTLRDKGYNQPVIYLTAKDKEEDILQGFERGGDDYITKPFSLEELKARIKAVIKRTKKELKIIKHRDIVFNLDTREVMIEDYFIELTHLEKDLLLEFMKNANKVMTRESLLENVWKDSFDKQVKTVNVAVKRLKEKIDPFNDKNYIKTIRGEGYMFC